MIKSVISLEEERFNQTIDSGMEILKAYIEEMEAKKEKELSGEKAFKLYDTYGFPLELTEEIVEEKGLSIDKDGFNREMEAQRERARSARGESSYMGSDGAVNRIDASIETTFGGYETRELTSKILVLGNEEDFKEELLEGEEGFLVVENTPFYAEMGGQIGDNGIISTKTGVAKVLDCKKNVGGKFVHYIKVTEGTIKVNEEAELTVNAIRRSAISKNHTATHMLHEA